MAKQTVNLGSSANDGTGDPLRTAFDKINDNFNELYSVTGAGSSNNVQISGNSIQSTDTNGNITLDPNGTGRVVVATASELRFTDHTDHGIAFVDADGDVQFSNELTYDATTNTATIEDITIKANTISSQNSNQNIVLDPSGTGLVNVNSALTVGTNLTVSGTSLLGAITINDNRITTNNTNENIAIDPSGTGTLNLQIPTQATVGSAGSAAALPAQPTGYIEIQISGTPRIIPFYDKS
jgi:hypothetical protein